MKKLIRQGNRRFATRKDRDIISELLKIGISLEDAWQEILLISSKDYVFDYKPTYAKSNNSLTFKNLVNGHVVYIKLKIEIYNNSETSVCLSFHLDNN